MKKCLWSVLAFLLFLPLCCLGMSTQAQAEQVQFELLGKLGGTSNTYKKSSLGDPIFDVSGGLTFSTLFRFDMGVGIGLNLNWTMIEQRMDETKLTYALEARERYTTFQLPSIGLAFRYEIASIADFGLWLNYGFGSDEIDYKSMNNNVATAFGLNRANLEWDLQSIEIGIMLAFMYKIKSINFDVVFGIQGFVDVSRMRASDSSLNQAEDISGRHLDENTVYTGGFHVVFGGRYDLFFGNSK